MKKENKQSGFKTPKINGTGIIIKKEDKEKKTERK